MVPVTEEGVEQSDYKLRKDIAKSWETWKHRGRPVLVLGAENYYSLEEECEADHLQISPKFKKINMLFINYPEKLYSLVGGKI